LTTKYHGRVPTDVGGAGVEFHATREYRRGDPVKRIDWNRRARTGELATLELREERAATVVLLIDAREAYGVRRERARRRHRRGRRASRPPDRRSPPRSTAGTGSGSRRWVRATAGSRREPARRTAPGRETLATDPALAPDAGRGVLPVAVVPAVPPAASGRRAGALFTPLLDDSASLARRIDAHGHLVTVLSPDVTAGDTPERGWSRSSAANGSANCAGRGSARPSGETGPSPVAVARATGRWSR